MPEPNEADYFYKDKPLSNGLEELGKLDELKLVSKKKKKSDKREREQGDEEAEDKQEAATKKEIASLDKSIATSVKKIGKKGTIEDIIVDIKSTEKINDSLEAKIKKAEALKDSTLAEKTKEQLANFKKLIRVIIGKNPDEKKESAGGLAKEIETLFSEPEKPVVMKAGGAEKKTEEKKEGDDKKNGKVNDQDLKALLTAIGAMHPEGFKDKEKDKEQETSIYDAIKDLPGLYEVLKKSKTFQYGGGNFASGWVVSTIKDYLGEIKSLPSENRFIACATLIGKFEDKNVRKVLHRLLIKSDPELRVESLKLEKQRYVDEAVANHLKNLKAKSAKRGVKKAEIEKYIDDTLTMAMRNIEEYPDFVDKLQGAYIKAGFVEKPERVSIRWRVFSNPNITLTDLEAELLKNYEIKWDNVIFKNEGLARFVVDEIEELKKIENKEEREKRIENLLNKVPRNGSFLNALKRVIKNEAKFEKRQEKFEAKIVSKETKAEFKGPLSVENGKEKLAVGDFVQWTSQGTSQWEAPRQIIRFSDDSAWAFFENSLTGIPVSQLTIEAQPGKVVEPTKPKEKPQDIRKVDEVQPAPKDEVRAEAETKAEVVAEIKPSEDGLSLTGQPKNGGVELEEQKKTMAEESEKPIEAKMPQVRARGYSEGLKTIPEMLDSGNFSEFLAYYPNSRDLIEGEDAEGMSAIYDIWGKKDKTIAGYNALFKDYFKDSLDVTLEPKDLEAIGTLIEKEALEDPEKFAERAKALEDFSSQAKLVKELEAKIPGFKQKIEGLRYKKQEVENTLSSRSNTEKFKAFFFWTDDGKKAKKLTEELKKIDDNLSTLEKGARTLEDFKAQRTASGASFNEMRKSITEEALVGSQVTEIAKKMAQEKLKTLMSGEGADFTKAQAYLDSLKDVRDEDELDVFDAGLDEAQYQEKIDKALEERTKKDIKSVIDNFSLGNKSFSNLEKAITKAVKNTSRDRLGSKDKTSTAYFVNETLEGIEKTLGNDPQSKAKRLLITAILAKAKYN